ncbi:hypothetical protein [Corynebacterium sp. MSK158]|uniref:hypothetical protein n=1 Tax=Corynebacterium sp. MSK158 TaxID=3050212 RepID=UPI002549EDDD|nr:hypothetical protein [Corynebacterium sp. MSK158]MDK8693598.1 hypothetical protein [Corynebacterium sp. MSK158]
MTDTPRPINITQSKGIWREHEIDIVLEVSPGMTTVLNVSREEAAALRDKLNQYLGETND